MEEEKSIERQQEILSIIQDNPEEGVTSSELAFIMKIAYVTITEDIKELLDADEIKKEKNRYFPV